MNVKWLKDYLFFMFVIVLIFFHVVSESYLIKLMLVNLIMNTAIAMVCGDLGWSNCYIGPGGFIYHLSIEILSHVVGVVYLALCNCRKHASSKR